MAKRKQLKSKVRYWEEYDVVQQCLDSLTEEFPQVVSWVRSLYFLSTQKSFRLFLWEKEHLAEESTMVSFVSWDRQLRVVGFVWQEPAIFRQLFSLNASVEATCVLIWCTFFLESVRVTTLLYEACVVQISLHKTIGLWVLIILSRVEAPRSSVMSEWKDLKLFNVAVYCVLWSCPLLCIVLHGLAKIQCFVNTVFC